MSFDLHMFQIDPGPDEGQRAAEKFTTIADALNMPGPLDPQAEQQKQHLVSLLTKIDPALEAFEKDYAALAAFEGTTEEQARLKWRHVELNGPPDDKLAQILIHDQHVTIHWYSGTSEDKMDKYLRTICEATGYAVWDPQAERVIRP